MDTMWLIKWADETFVTDSFEKAVAFVEKNVERLFKAKDSLTVTFDAQEWGYHYIGRRYQYLYTDKEGKKHPVDISIDEVEVV